MRTIAARVATLSLALSLLLAFAAPSAAQSLRVYVIDVGQGSSTLFVGPTGTTLLVDGGPDQSGWISSPSGPGPIAQLLGQLGIAQLDYTLLTHYHSDHYEGIAELAQQGYLKPSAKAFDRGNSPAPENGFTAAINAYIAAVGTKRATIALGQVIDLGGGVTAKCVVRAGAILGGPTIDTTGSAQKENSNSLALLVEFGNFDLFVGGDLTGGGGSTTNVEGPAAPFIGNVDVYISNHHGSSTSSNATFIATLLPEVSIASCGLQNSFSHPSTTFLNNVNTAARTTVVYSTTGGTNGSGSGNLGFVNSVGTVKLETDGNRYLLTPGIGRPQLVLCDELSPGLPGPAFGDLRVTEFMADPNVVADTSGEWFEVMNVSGLERNLNGLKISNTAGTELMTLATPIVLKPGQRLVMGNNADSQRNGGSVQQICEPFNVFTLGNSGDSIRLRSASNLLIDDVNWTSSWPEAAGVASQKIDVLGSNASSNWALATANFGGGDKGTPGAKNTADATSFPALFVSTQVPQVGQSWTVNFVSLGEPGSIHVSALAQSTGAPQFELLGHVFPLTLDGLLAETIGLPGFVNFLDADGFSQTVVSVPNDPLLHGYAFFGATGTYGFPSILPGKLSTPVFVIIP